MAEAKHYEVNGFVADFTPQDSPYKGILVIRAPELEPFTAEVNLSKPRSCNEYASRAQEICGMSKSGLKVVLNALCSRRYEEVAAAREAEQEEADRAEEHPEISQEEIDELIGRPGVLGRLVESVATYSRVVKEWNMLKLITLQALSAQLELLPNDKPIGTNVIVTAEAGRGKNFVCDAVARVLPPEFYFAFESSSAMALYYRAVDDPAFLRHRWLYPNEAEAADLLVEMFRPLLSGGSAKHITVNKDASGRNVGAEFVIVGPVTLAIPTVRNKLDSQLQTRMLVAGLEHYPGRVADHSREVSRLISHGYAATDYSGRIQAWQAALRSLTLIRRVVIPVEHEQFCFDSDEVSHGARIWTNVMGLMCTHAWLEQGNREVMELPNREMAIVASPEDYQVAYTIFKQTCERSVVNLSETHRKILDAAYELQRDLQLDEEWDTWKGLTQRKLAEKAGVSQSTVSGNRSFLVKSVKLMRETREGGLALVEGAEPSWWEKGDVLDGFPRPEEVRAWWSGNSPTLDPEGTDHADHHVDGTITPHGEGAKGDRDAADRSQDAADHPREDDHRSHRDREDEGGDREAADREFGLSNTNNVSNGEAIGMIGGIGGEDMKSVSTSPNGEVHDTHSHHVPYPPRERQGFEEGSWEKPEQNAHVGLAEPHNQNVATGDADEGATSTSEVPPNELEGPSFQGFSFLKIAPSRRGPLTKRAAQIESRLRRHYVDHPQDRSLGRDPDLREEGVFANLGFTPSSTELLRVRMMIANARPDEDVPPPLEEAPIMETERHLRDALPPLSNGHTGERDPDKLIEHVVARNPRMFFVPTLEEMMEAMRRLGLEPAPEPGNPECEARIYARTLDREVPEVEKAIRRAQRAPRLSWPDNGGSLNPVQEWARHKGYGDRDRRTALRFIASFLHKEGYLASEPPLTEVKVAMDKLVAEMKEAAARDKDREQRRRIEARSVKVDGIEEREEDTRSRYPKRITELVNSLRRCWCAQPSVIELYQDYEDWHVQQAAEFLHCLPYSLPHCFVYYPLTPKDFTEEEAEEALRILLKEKEIQDHILLFPEERAHRLCDQW